MNILAIFVSNRTKRGKAFALHEYHLHLASSLSPPWKITIGKERAPPFPGALSTLCTICNRILRLIFSIVFSHKKVMISDNWDTWWRESNDIDQYSIHEVIPWLSVFVALLTISLIIQIQRDSNSRNIKIEHKKQRDILEGIALGSETFHYLAICSFSCPSILLSPIY